MKRVPLPDDLVAEARAMHETDARGYHSWSHPLDMLEASQPIRALLHDRLAIMAAIILHDIVYDPRRADNEERSALFAERRLADVVPEITVQRTARMIRATAKHKPHEGLSDEDLSDTSHFLDLDLAVLGADQMKFERYEAGVRHEYRHVEWSAYARGRAAILEAFLERPHIYFTDWGRSTFEARARRNLMQSIGRLRQSV
ncbi:hypothetical protein [Sphingomonas sp. 3-13AW]|uniref:HD domain-containing protein n=1 Tax=Sphingomonas sp. 3-13AW TaxID=3050450 RepID=UPI003BB54FCB